MEEEGMRKERFFQFCPSFCSSAFLRVLRVSAVDP
jgi:hypothetical protein